MRLLMSAIGGKADIEISGRRADLFQNLSLSRYDALIGGCMRRREFIGLFGAATRAAGSGLYLRVCS
jgi:hypothetical protein